MKIKRYVAKFKRKFQEIKLINISTEFMYKMYSNKMLLKKLLNSLNINTYLIRIENHVSIYILYMYTIARKINVTPRSYTLDWF